MHRIINYGLKLHQLYDSHNYWKYGTNYVVNIFHQHLSDLKESIATEKWPHTLFLQIDNCWKKNKNTTIMKYLDLFLKFGGSNILNYMFLLQLYS
jgi:hypothetical protein